MSLDRLRMEILGSSFAVEALAVASRVNRGGGLYGGHQHQSTSLIAKAPLRSSVRLYNFRANICFPQNALKKLVA